MTAPPAGALPPLPEPDFLSGNCNVGESAYTADQMREYALLAALRLREECEARIRAWRAGGPNLIDQQHVIYDYCADDLARVLEESATGGEAGSA